MTVFTVSSHRLDTALVVQAGGELDYAHAPVFRAELTRVWETGTPATVVVDVTGLTFCDSAGIAELIWALNRSRDLGTRLVLAGVHGVLERILAITGLRPAFELSPTVGEALSGA
ncbi:STAS domain-containing protein [Planomonospora parontospora]|uniref:STAS domain-containing protein n=1 Tax=Planomonospora parontospora TaxID=58119 RepID=UPI001670FBA5|nr:STAS domain-containing protein [Planomonospora parontospora]GGL37328.1 anti-sigma factor antagonist [Planomonospora parontospora subsp. antibiotica]GII17597.1 anti-sigma factor antagonist [Planomonospora parontospora subsp. antibiotica]